MTYDEAVRYLLTLGGELSAPRQPARTGSAGVPVAKFDLRNITLLADRLSNPHRAYPCVHIAGTNGKGSTAAMLESILRAAGMCTGLYTSPHLERINERIRVSGENISDTDFAEAFSRVHAMIEVMLASGTLTAHPTYFECITAMAFDHFARKRVDFAVFEVGMGGRLDSTNIVTPEVAVITQIDFDHENFLGHSIEQIAGEKAGIIKPGVPVVCSAERPEARAVIAQRCAEQHAPLIHIDDTFQIADAGAQHLPRAKSRDVPPAPQLFAIATKDGAWRMNIEVPLAGRYQIRNALAAVATARLLAQRGFAIDDAAIARGIAATRWPGRLELLQAGTPGQPAVYLDGTHNPAGARELLAFWDQHFTGKRIHLVYGAMRDKAVDEITGLLFPCAARVILTSPHQPRAISAEALAEMTEHLAQDVEVVAEPEAALERAIEGAAPGDAVFATGSLYLAGDLRRYWHSPRRAASHVCTPHAAGKLS